MSTSRALEPDDRGRRKEVPVKLACHSPGICDATPNIDFARLALELVVYARSLERHGIDLKEDS